MNTTTQADSKKVGFKGKIDRFFKISERGSTIGRELLGGLIIFLAMIYILPVNADILGNGANMGFAAVFVATAIATGVTTILMGLIANYPIGLSAGMGLNALMAYTGLMQKGILMCLWETKRKLRRLIGIILLH